MADSDADNEQCSGDVEPHQRNCVRAYQVNCLTFCSAILGSGWLRMAQQLTLFCGKCA